MSINIADAVDISKYLEYFLFMKEFIEKVKKSKIPISELAKHLNCSKIYLYQIIKEQNIYEPSKEFKEKAYKWASTCWVCGRDDE